MIVTRTTLYAGGHANDPGYRGTTLDAGNGREWHCYSDPDGSNVRRLETRAMGSGAGFRGVGNDKRATEISKAIKAHLAGSNIAAAKTLDGIEHIALQRMATMENLARDMLAALQRSLRLVEKQDADSGCIAFMEMANAHRAIIARAEAAGITQT